MMISAAIGLALGAVLAWVLTRSRMSADIAVQQAHAAALESRLEQVSAESAQRLADQRELFTQRLEEIKGDHTRLSDTFDALAAKALERNTSVFLDQAEQRLARTQAASTAELAKREAAVKALVEPLTKSLEGVHKQMTAAEVARAEANGAIAEQIKMMTSASDALRSETTQLTKALRASHVRGQWGELQLRRVVEVAGMLDHVDFSEQMSIEADGEKHRPDMVVHLPGSKQIVVDAKVSLSAFLDAAETDDDGERAGRMAAHARHMRTHVDSLAGKAYWEHLTHTPEFVVMFVPSDAMLSAALSTDPHLLENAFTQNVIVATPATLVALLRTVAYTWRQERLADDAQKIFTTGRELHKRLGIFGRHLDDLGKRLNDTVSAFNRLNRSIDSTLVPQAKRFAELQDLSDAFTLRDPIETMAVPAKKAELFTDHHIEASNGTQ